jgi:hypothetical protein
MLARFRASVFPGGITVASTDVVGPPNPPEIRRAEVSGVRCSLEPARSSLWIQVPHGSGVWGRLCRPGSPCLSGRPSSSGTSQPGILPLQFFLHLLGSYWVGCRGVQGSRNTGRVTGRQRRKVGRDWTPPDDRSERWSSTGSRSGDEVPYFAKWVWTESQALQLSAAQRACCNSMVRPHGSLIHNWTTVPWAPSS